MSRFIVEIVVAIGILAAQPACTSNAAESSAELDIRDADGEVLLAADQIRSYDGATHTLMLAPGARGKLQSQFHGDVNRKTKHLVSGISFTVCVGGKSVYNGTFTTSVSSFSFDAPVIVFDSVVRDRMAGENELRIQLGYPTQKFFKGDDPRPDKRIEEALQATGKLVNTRDDRIRWVAASLQEMQTIQQGSTRAELLKVFVEEGGLSNRREGRYAYRDCPYFKVNVKFDFADSRDDKTQEDPQDRVSQICAPFLEWQIAD